MRTIAFKLCAHIARLVVVGILSLNVGFAGSNCQPVTLTVVNSSAQAFAIRGAEGVMKVPANSTTQVAFKSNNFYTKCGLIEAGFNDQAFAKGLIAESTKEVHLYVQPSGEIEALGLTEPGFKLEEYISWWGLGSVLG